MKNLIETDYVIYDKSTDFVVHFTNKGRYVIYGDKESALEDCLEGQEPVRCVDLPEHQKELLIKQIQTT